MVVQRDLSKVIMALPAFSGNIEIFEKTLTDSFRCVNTRLVFEKKKLLPNLTQHDFNKMDITESFKAFKKDDLTICYKLKLDGEKNYSNWRVIAKILTLDRNNQYGFSVSKPMSIGCIKEKKNRQGRILFIT